MPFFARGKQDIIANTVNDLINNTNLTRLTSGGKARSILEAVSEELGIAYDTFDLDLLKTFLSSAEGELLELIGALVGESKEPSAAAQASSTLQIHKLYVATGTFGDINSDTDIYLDQNVVFSSRSNGQGITYRLSEPVTLSASDSVEYISLEASIPGNDSNVGNNALVFHDFTNYADYLNESLLTTNIHAIANGRDEESDTNFRYRISQKVLEAQAANETAMRLAALSIPGVADVTIYPRWRGIGTSLILLQSVTPTVTSDLLATVQLAVNNVTANGDLSFAKGPLETGLTFEITVHYKKKLSDTELAKIEDSIETKIVDYINNFDIGDSFTVNALAAQLFSVSDNIANIGEANQPFDFIYIYKESAVEDNKIRETLLGDYTPEDKERVIIEPSVLNPVSITRAYVRN